MIALMIDKLPPQALDIEEAFLGALLIEGDLFADVKTILPVEAFYHLDNQSVYDAMHEIHSKNGKIDILTVSQNCNISASYIASLSSRVATASHYKYHLSIIYDKWVARECIRIGSELVANAYEADDILDTLQEVRNTMDKRILHFLGINSTGISIIDAANKSIDDYYIREQNYKEGKLSGLPTTFKELNRMTGGLNREQLIILAARPGMGKTSLAIAFMMTAASANLKAAFFSLEMTSERLMDKVICSLANIDHADYKRGRLQESQKQLVENCLAIVNSWSVTFNDTMLAEIEQIHATCKKIKEQKGLDIIFVDYLQLMRTREKTGNREQEISTMSRKAKMMAVDLGVPVVMMSQLNRGLESRADKRPMLSDLRESGAIEQDADIVLFIYRDSEYNEDAQRGDGELIVAKHREGERGIIKFKHNDSMTRFSDEEDIPDIDMFSKESKPF